MGNHALRRQLSKALKEAGCGKLYTCTKRKVYKYLSAGNMRDLLDFLKVKPGMKVFEYGVNQVVKKAPDIEWMDWHSRRGGFYYKADQVHYESGYLSCGCGHYGCFTHNDAFRLRTKAEIVEQFRKELSNKEWPNNLAIMYFNALEKGLDILDDDGFLIANYFDKVKGLEK
jgi:hypothetical protein